MCSSALRTLKAIDSSLALLNMSFVTLINVSDANSFMRD